MLTDRLIWFIWYAFAKDSLHTAEIIRWHWMFLHDWIDDIMRLNLAWLNKSNNWITMNWHFCNGDMKSALAEAICCCFPFFSIWFVSLLETQANFETK